LIIFTFFCCERSSTGSNDCFVVVLVLVLGIIHSLVILKSKSLFVPCNGTFCVFPWHIRLFVPCCGTFCAVLWHISLKVSLCHAMAHFVPLLRQFLPTTRLFRKHFLKLSIFSGGFNGFLRLKQRLVWGFVAFLSLSKHFSQIVDFFGRVLRNFLTKAAP
jgi:hypothetical protein